MIPLPVVEHYSKKRQISLDAAKDIFKELESFLNDVIAKKSSTPTEKLDDAWHDFILHTKLYAEYCQKNFNSFIHHNPSLTNECTKCDAQEEA